MAQPLLIAPSEVVEGTGWERIDLTWFLQCWYSALEINGGNWQYQVSVRSMTSHAHMLIFGVQVHIIDMSMVLSFR